MNKRTWALITLSQTALLIVGLVFATARGGAAAPSPAQAVADAPANVAAQASPAPDYVPTITRRDARAIIEGVIRRPSCTKRWWLPSSTRAGTSPPSTAW